MSSCEPGFTDVHHLYGLLPGQCVAITAPRILCLIEMIISAVNACVSAIKMFKIYRELKEKNKKRDYRMFKNFWEAFKKFPVLQVLFSSHLSMLSNFTQFALLYVLDVKLSTGSTAALIAAITSFTVKICRTRIMFFSLKFYNGFADDLSTFFPIPKPVRKTISKVLFFTTVTSVATFSILYIVLNFISQTSPHRMWMAALANVLESLAFGPVFSMAIYLALRLKGVLQDHFKDSKDETFHKDFAYLFCGGTPLCVFLFLAFIPAIAPISSNYMVPLREICVAAASINYMNAQGKVYVRREKMKNPDNSNPALPMPSKDTSKDHTTARKDVTDQDHDTNKITTDGGNSTTTA